MSRPPNINRRQFIGQSACAGLGLTGLLSTVGTLRLFNAALSAQGVPDPDDSKILVCLFLFGGNDANNLLVPRDAASHAAYARDRGILGLGISDILALNNATSDGREFGFHEKMAPLQPIYNAGKMAMIGNVGTLVAPITKAEYLSGGAAIPPHLFSHNDQQVQWQTSVPDSPRKVGWGGRMADLLHELQNNSDISMNVSIAGSNFFQVGEEVLQYHVTPGGSIGLSEYTETYAPVMQQYQGLRETFDPTRSYGHIFEQEYAKIMHRAVANDTLLKSVLATHPIPSPAGDFVRTLHAPPTNPPAPANRVAEQLRMVLKMIHARQTLGMKRQIFFAALGGFDTHDDQLDHQALLLEELSNGIADFYDATVGLGISDKVTLYTASDFNRTYNSNGKGSDHAWGGHHMVVGGAVDGGKIYGEMPSLEINGPDDTGSRGSWIPKISTDQMAATLARWFGISEAQLPLVLPNIGRFSRSGLDFMGPMA